MEQGARRIKRVENTENWFLFVSGHWKFILGNKGTICDGGDASLLEFVRELHALKIGEIASRWDRLVLSHEWKDRETIEWRHAKVKLGDVFDFYTTADGVLKVPHWVVFKYAVEEYLEEEPKIKYHPDRVRRFIEERGMEQLEEMQ
ncbi:unnamed protein product [Phytophthora lilii]|uniref:Unnamed protein product n=1 Tax=Phytophthora lilii TaxID=2077276 RepID=A0A9W6XBC9_9STRA|nr:unnamed protein product [Phytophthora lilii]